MSGFKRATRRAVRLKLAIQGPSGSGKSLGALALAAGLAEGGKVAVIDTENGSASLYGDRYVFDTLDLSPPYLTKKYLDAIEQAVEGGYKVLVIDSISHQWDGDGGILQRKDEADTRPNTNHWTNWGPFTKEHNRFRATLLSAPLHIIATMRSKMAYTQSEGTGGKKKIEKLGLQPLQREGMEYEFAVTWDVGMDHMAAGSKDRTGLFGEPCDLTNKNVAKRLLEWLASAPSPAAISEDQRRRMWALATGKGMDEPTLRALVKETAKVESTRDIPLDVYNTVIDAIEDWKKPDGEPVEA